MQISTKNSKSIQIQFANQNLYSVRLDNDIAVELEQIRLHRATKVKCSLIELI